MLLTLLKIKKKTSLTFRCSAHYIYRCPVYHEAEVFREYLALSPPPFRPYNCVTGAPLPTSRLYSLFKSERKAIDNWLTGHKHHSAIFEYLVYFEYLVIPFGLTIAPAVFRDLVNDVLWDFINHFLFVNLDDISRTLQEHEFNVRQDLQHLLENKLFVKCEFYVDTISFPGYIVEKGHLKLDTAKVFGLSLMLIGSPTKPLHRKLILALWLKKRGLNPWSYESYQADNAGFLSRCRWEASPSLTDLTSRCLPCFPWYKQTRVALQVKSYQSHPENNAGF